MIGFGKQRPNFNEIRARLKEATSGGKPRWWIKPDLESASKWFLDNLKAGNLGDDGSVEFYAVATGSDNSPLIIAITGNGPESKANSAFIACAHQDITDLLAYIEKLEAKNPTK